MKLFRAIKKRAALWALSNMGWFSESKGVSGLINVPGLDRPAENVVMAYGCIVTRREMIGSVPVMLTDRNDNLIESGLLYERLQRPSPDLNWDEYVRVLETHLTTYNMCAVAKVGEERRPPDELVPLSPGYLSPLMGRNAETGTPRVIRWRYRDPFTNAEREYEPGELMLSMGYNPHAPLQALSPLKVLRRTMQNEIAAREVNLSYLHNDATPPYVLQSDQRLNRDQAEEMLELWQDKFSGFRNKFKPGILWGGLKVDKIGLTPAEMEYIAGLKFLRTDYYIVFRVKPGMLGEMTGETGLSQGSATDEQKVEWWEDVGLGELNLIAQLHETELVQRYDWSKGRLLAPRARALNGNQQVALRRWRGRRGLAGPRNDFNLWFNENQIPALVRHRLAKIDQLDKILKYGWTPDEASDYLDLGLPEHPTNVGTIPFSLQPVTELAGREDKTEEPRINANERELENAGNLHGTFESLRAMIRAEGEDQIPRKWEALWKVWNTFRTAHEKATARKYSRFFFEQRGRVLEGIKRTRGARDGEGEETTKHTKDTKGEREREEYSPRMERTTDEDGEQKVTKVEKEEGERKREVKSRADFSGLLDDAFDLNAENEELLRSIGPLVVTTMEAAWEEMGAELGAESMEAHPFSVDDPDIQNAVSARKLQATKINETTIEDMRGLIGKAVDEGWDTLALADEIDAYYKRNCLGETKARPKTAARTQVAGVVNDARYEAARDAGGLRKGWLQGAAGDPREAHTAAQAHYLNAPIALEENFVVNGIEMKAPGDANAPIGETANCTCMVVFVPEN